MRRRPISVPSFIALAVCLSSGCGTDEGAEASADAAPAAGVRLVDAAGNEVVLDRAARRVVSLVPSVTATLRAMGADAVLVGRTDFDTEPWALRLPSVGGGIEPNLEALLTLEPDLVVRFAGEQDPRTPSRLDALGVPHLAVRPDRIDDIYRTARLLGEATGHRRPADSLVSAIREGLAAVEASVRGLPRVPTAYVLGGEPPWVAGPGTYIDEIITLAGGENVFPDLDALYSAVSSEELRTRDIQVVLLAPGAAYDGNLTPRARIESVGDALEIPGPDVVESASRVADLLHGRELP